MNPDDPRELESMAMDTDDDAVSYHHPHRSDPAETNFPGPSAGRMSPDSHPQRHQIVGSVQTSTHSALSHPSLGYEHPSGPDGSLQLMIPQSPSSAVNHLEEIVDIDPNHRLPRQRRGILLRLESSIREFIPQKRKHDHDALHTLIADPNYTQDNNASTDGANSHLSRRTRPRLSIQQDREFSPLIYMSPGHQRSPPVEEETISAAHYTLNVTDPSGSVQGSYLEDPSERDMCTQQSSSLIQVTDLGNYKDHERSDSVNSFAEVALASTVTRKHGRLSTLQDFWLPRPFEETDQPTVGIVKVHARGLEAGPSFLSISGGRGGGPSASREPAQGSPTDNPIRSSPRSTNFFDKPICDSPSPIDPTSENRLTHAEVPCPRFK